MLRAHEYHNTILKTAVQIVTQFFQEKQWYSTYQISSLVLSKGNWRCLEVADLRVYVTKCINFLNIFWNYNPLCKAHEYHYNLEDSGPNCHAILSRKRGPTIIISSWRFTRILNFKKSRPPFRTCAWKKLFAGSRDSFCCLRLKFELQYSNLDWQNYNK